MRFMRQSIIRSTALWSKMEKNTKKAMSEGVSEVSEQTSKQVSAAECASEASRAEQANE